MTAALRRVAQNCRLPVHLTEGDRKSRNEPMLVGLINFLLLAGVILLLLGVGLTTTVADIRNVAHQYPSLLRGVVANFLLVPCAISLIVDLRPPHPDVAIGLLILAAVPVAPLAPPFVSMAGGDVPCAVGLMVIVSLLGVLISPIILSVPLPSSELGLRIETLKIFHTLTVAQIAPLIVGIIIRNQFPFVTTNLLRAVPTAAKVCLGPALVMLTITQAAHVWALGFQSFIMLIFAVLTCLSIGLLVARNEAVGVSEKSEPLQNRVYLSSRFRPERRTEYCLRSAGGVTNASHGDPDARQPASRLSTWAQY